MQIKTSFLLFQPLQFFYSKKNLLCLFLFLENYIVLKLFSIGFLKAKPNYLSFIFADRLNYISFLKYFCTNFFGLNSLYFFRFKLKGLGYRIIRICKKLYKFFFLYTNFYYLHLPLSIFLKVKNRRLIFFSFDLQCLRLSLANLLLLKRSIIYLVRGLLFPRQIIVLKPGKKRL